MNRKASTELDLREKLLADWAKREATICSQNAQEFDLEWGRLREEFFDEVGSVPLPSSDIDRLGTLKDKYKGERIFILGNGPSINRTPLHLLKDEYTFGVNRINLLYERIDWKPTFYTALDWRVVPDIAREINALTGSTFFFEERFRGLLREGDDVYYYSHSAASPDHPEDRVFSNDISRGVRGAGSVIGTAIQIAFHMGFDPIYLIGCDLGYKVADTVKQEGEDKFGNGVKLQLTSTEDDDANHFDPRYFGKGRRWHDPNVKRMIEGHQQCLKGVTNANKKIFNATMGGELEVYPRRHFLSLFPEQLQTSKSRDARAHVDETAVVSRMLRERKGPKHVMLDIGAHQGTSAVYFDKLGWSIHCFEPDRSNRARLLARFGDRADLYIDPRAVSDKPARGVSFFTSEESSGISGLHAFRETHEVSDKVDVTTVDEVVTARGITSVDFLKIDVEGFDLNVLKGVPWDKLKPDVVECEFEDAKTVKMGHTWRDVAEYLRTRGYAVYLSEWHPIERYGVQHDWKRIVPYPGIDMDANAWGNIIAFRDDPGYKAVSDAFAEMLKYHNHQITPKPPKLETKASSIDMANVSTQKKNDVMKPAIAPSLEQSKSSAKTMPPTAKTNGANGKGVNSPNIALPKSIKLPIEDQVSTSPGFPGFKKFAKTTASHLRNRLKWIAPLFLSVLLLGSLGLVPSLSGFAVYILLATIVFGLTCGLTYVAFRSQSHAQALQIRADALEKSCIALRDEVSRSHIKNLNLVNATLESYGASHASTLQTLENRFAHLKEMPRKIEQMSDRTSKYDQQLSEVHRHLATLSDKSHQAEERLQETNSLFANFRPLVDSIGKRCSTAENDISALNSAISLQDASLSKLIERLDAEIEALKVYQGLELDRRLDELKSNREEAVEDQIKTFENTIAGETAHLQSLISSTDGRVSDALNEIRRVEMASDALAAQLEANESEVQKLADHVDGAVTSLTKSVDQKEGEILQTLEAIETLIDNKAEAARVRESELESRVQASIDVIREATNPLPSIVAAGDAKADRALERSDEIERWMSFNNAGWFQTFNRKLEAQHISTFERNWKRKLSLPINKFSLSYSADSLCEIEQRLHGRLATSVEDFLLRLSVAQSVKGESISVLSIGVLFGIDVAAMYDALSLQFNEVHFSLLDPLDGYYRTGQIDGLTGIPVTEHVLKSNLSSVGMGPENFTLIKSLSTDLEAIAEAEKSRYDLLVIDGDHSYAGVKADFENYARNVKLGGYIIFDDYDSSDWPEIKEFVDNEVSKYDFLSRVGHSWRTCVYRVVKPHKLPRTRRAASRSNKE